MTLFTLVLATALSAGVPVKADVVVAKDGSGDFTSIQAAINSVRSFRPEGRSVIYVRNGVYEEKVVLHSHKSEISLIGEDAEKTVLIWHDHANMPDGRGGTIGTFETYTLRVDGPDFICENITIANDAMTHLNPDWRKDHIDRAGVGQAVALHVEADRAVFRGCRFLGYQDTIYTGNPDGREYFDHCYIEGTVDFIFGPATCWFEQCTVHELRKGAYYTAASTPEDHEFGYVFNRCRLTAEPEATGLWLGRPWRNYAYTLFLNCEMDADIVPAGWHNWGDPAREKTARYIEYGSTGRGAGILPSDKAASGIDASRVRAPWSHTLSAREAARITPGRVFSRPAGVWRPQ